MTNARLHGKGSRRREQEETPGCIVNGKRDGELEDDVDCGTDCCANCTLNCRSGTEDYFSGHIRDLRIFAGVSLYTKRFDPANSTCSQLGYYHRKQLLAHWRLDDRHDGTNAAFAGEKERAVWDSSLHARHGSIYEFGEVPPNSTRIVGWSNATVRCGGETAHERRIVTSNPAPSTHATLLPTLACQLGKMPPPLPPRATPIHNPLPHCRQNMRGALATATLARAHQHRRTRARASQAEDAVCASSASLIDGGGAFGSIPDPVQA